MSADNLVKMPRPRLAEWLMEPMRRNRDTYLKVAVAAVVWLAFWIILGIAFMSDAKRVEAARA